MGSGGVGDGVGVSVVGTGVGAGVGGCTESSGSWLADGLWQLPVGVWSGAVCSICNRA